jgi:predicted dehydrogenase
VSNTESNVVNVAVIGCGNISKPYGRTISATPTLKIVGAADIDPQRAAEYVAEFGGTAYESIDALLADPAVDLVVNLTIHHAHYEVITRCLNAGKHVYSEKPLALSAADAQALVKLADEKKLRLGSAPMVFLGEAQQTAWKYIREGNLGTVRVAYAEVNWGRIESWHPNPVPFYGVGPMFDVGVYPLSVLTTIFGPVQRVTGYGKTVYPDRVTLDGEPFHLKTPDFIVALLEHVDGTLTRLTADFYVSNNTSRQQGIEFHGDKGSLYLQDWAKFDSPLLYAPFGEAMTTPVEPVKAPYNGEEWVDWARGVADMADSILNGTPQRVTGAHAAHIVEILEAVQTSYQNDGKSIALSSTFVQPEPMEWAR